MEIPNKKEKGRRNESKEKIGRVFWGKLHLGESSTEEKSCRKIILLFNSVKYLPRWIILISPISLFDSEEAGRRGIRKKKGQARARNKLEGNGRKEENENVKDWKGRSNNL